MKNLDCMQPVNMSMEDERVWSKIASRDVQIY